jgi:hypothetical protein
MSEMTFDEMVAEMRSLRARVLELEDREAIRELKAQYFRLVDEKAWDKWSELFTDDVHVDLGGGRTLTGNTAFADAVHGMLDGPSGFAVSVHRGQMPEITIDSPTTARATWGLADYIEWPADSETGERCGYRGYGHEREVYRKVDGQWKIAEWYLSYIRMDPLPRTPLPETILGGPGEMQDDEYLDGVTSGA